MWIVWFLGLLVVDGGAEGASPRPAQQPDVFYGKQVAERSCGGCHAVSYGSSPMSLAPAFADLHRRYPTDRLDQLLRDGIILPGDRMQEEGSRYTHPRMPATALGDDEIAALKAYIASLRP